MSIFDHVRIPRTNVVASILEFPPIDTDGMIKKMRLKELAQEQGARGLPSSDSEVFDSVEQNIINEIGNEAKVQFNAYLDHQNTYAERAGDASIRALTHMIGATAGDATTNFERNTHIGTSDLYARKREVIESERELKRFRERHGLKRPPRDYAAATYKIGVLVLILAIESLLNGFFLSKGSDFGLIGGFLQALLIASINVFCGVAIGRLVLPWVTHRNWSARAVASVGIATYLLANTGFNLAVAHYRNAVASDPFEASSIAYRSLLANPLGIDDLQSWSLFIIGFLFSLIAAYDGFRMNDPYPGYGQRMKQNLEALDEYNALKDELLGDLEQIKKSSEEKMDDLVRSIATRESEFDFIVLKSQALKNSMLQHFTHLESAANTLLSYYRDENRRHRQTPPPIRFNARWKFVHPSMEGQVVADPNRGTFNEELKRALDEARTQREALHNAFRKAYAEYKRIDELVEIESVA